MSKQRVGGIKADWDFAFGVEPSEEAVNRVSGWVQAFGPLPVARAIEKTAATTRTSTEAEALECVRLTLKQWRARGWV